MIDSRKRSMTKAVIWKSLGIVILSLLTWFITGSLHDMTLVAVSYHLFMSFIYFIHEQVWNSIKWGKTKGIFIQMTGLSGAGKSTLSEIVATRLRKRGIKVEVIDGDRYRENLCQDLGFSKEDRNTNIRRLGFVGKQLAKNNIVVIMAAINPYEELRQEVKENYSFVKTVFVKAELGVVEDRDVKGLYKRARLPDGHAEKIYNFTGVSDPFEAPDRPDLVINTDKESVSKSVKKLEKFILENI